jgi:peptidoglycan/LPS O-acetylase OafA/YrhL
MEVGAVALAIQSDPSNLSLSGPAWSGRPGAATSAGRMHWIDWLRVAAIAGVFVFHSLRPFDATDWHVKNAETNDLIGASQIFFSTFGLAVLFLLAGAGVQFALRKRSGRTFLRERTARLLVPFAVGTLLLSPIQGLIEETHKGTAASGPPDIVGWWSGAIEWMVSRGVSPTVFGIGYHLWFLGFLFAFSVVGLPICAALRGRRGTDAIAALAGRVAAWPGSTLGFAAPIAVLMLVFAPLGTDEHDWSEFGWFFAYFVIGFVLLADERFLVAVRRDLPVAAAAGLLSTAALVGLDIGEWLTNSESRGVDLRSLAMVLVFVLEGWAWTLVVLNIGLRMAQLQHPVSPRIGDAVLPVYVIHQPVILAVAFFVVQWPLGILPKWIVVFGASLAITLALVELGLRGRITRVLLGARTQPATPVVPAPDQVAGGEPPIARPTAGTHHARPR